MGSRQKPRKPGSLALLTCLLWVGACATSADALAADDPAVAATATEFAPGSDLSVRPPATFFTINAVLAKLDRLRGAGPNAIRLASIQPSGIETDARSLPKAAAPARGEEPFGLFTFRAPEGTLWRKWRGVEADMAKEQTILDRCRSSAEDCPSYAAQFLRLINAVTSRAGRARLEEANRAVNMAIRYVSDLSQHGEVDRWSAPLATFATAKGDCEDYAIAKYVALREAGFPRDQLRLLLVRDRAVRQDPAVLAARIDDRWLILDNRNSGLIEDSDATSFTPLFAIDHDGVHLFAAPYAKGPVLDGEDQAIPAANSNPEWHGLDESGDHSAGLGSLPLLL